MEVLFNATINSTTVQPEFLIVELSPVGRIWLLICGSVIVSTWFRILWHGPLERVAAFIPESGLLLVLGIVLGVVMHYTGFGRKEVEDGGDFFFSLLLPLIILPSGYFLDAKVFLGGVELLLILMHAIVGTIITAVTIGLLVWVAAPILVTPIPVLQALAFGALLSATDPVAVLAIFEQAHVTSRLFNLVAGESLINDAAGITLYGFFVQLTLQQADDNSFPPVAVGWAFLQFLVISLGGLVFGLIGGALAALTSRFSDRLGVLEPIMVVLFSFLVYVTADWVGISGIIALFTCAVVQSFFADRNMREGSRLGTRSLIYLLGQLSETIVFLLIGATTFMYCVNPAAAWDGALIGIVFAIIIPLRFVVVFLINTGVNLGVRSNNRVRFTTSILQAWSGLRGPVGFVLAIELPKAFAARSQMISTVIIIIWGTLFVIGVTTKPMIKCLDIELAAHGVPEAYDVVTTFGRGVSRVFVRPLHREELRVGKALRDRTGNVAFSIGDVNLRRVQEVASGKDVECNEEEPGKPRRDDAAIPLTDLQLFGEIDTFPFEIRTDLDEHRDLKEHPVHKPVHLNFLGFESSESSP